MCEADVTAPHPSVRVRMYRHGLGDCFLLTLPSTGERPFYLMIDCGVILGTANPKDKMRAVVQDLIATTGGHIDLLAITHEHYDHLSGFLQAKELFALKTEEENTEGKLHIHNLWLPWTEDPQDALARLLRGQRKQAEHGLRLALQGLRVAEAAARETDHALGMGDGDGDGDGDTRDNGGSPFSIAGQVESLLSFFGATDRRGTTGALEAVHDYAREAPRYLRPTDPPIVLEAVPGIRVYVLGPPQDEKLIKKSRPSSAHPEVYEAAFGLTPGNAFLAAVLDDQAAEEWGFDDLRELGQPFDRRYRIPLQEAEQLPFFKARYWGQAQEVEYRDQSWRRIDADWLRSAVDLALKLDSDTNNTSLVLALEIIASGEVLLFPGDAQVGNWLSWGALRWTLDDGTVVTGDDLLSRTVLYKVGHHGSHNATLREKGLERMVHEDLVALVPVDHAMAVKKGWGKIPFQPLLDRLEEKTRGRILRADAPEKLHDQKAPANVPAATWKRFQERVEEEALYFEVRVGG